MADVKTEALPDLDDLLQCPVCYEIPTGQIFQCNEGHHVCGRCKLRLDVCPVCRALFFGTRNYAMEELIANIRKLRAFKLGGKVTTGSTCSESNSSGKDASSTELENDVDNDDINDNNSTGTALRAPPACKGLFRCLCCKNGNSERLPSARLLNHLRYYHAPELIEGKTENGEYVQAWQFATTPGRLVTAVRVADMGIFFLVIEINNDAVCAWLSMASAPWVAHEFSYTVTISGNDREAIFSDCVWSVRSCEGSLKKRGHCLVVNGLDARALTAPAAISGKLSIKRTPPEQLEHQAAPRAVLRVASRAPDSRPHRDLEPYLQGLQNDVARLSLAFATLGREADALARSEAQIRARIERPNSNPPVRPNNAPPRPNNVSAPRPASVPEPAVVPPPLPGAAPLSRNARRRMRQRLLAALNEPPQAPAQRRPAPARSASPPSPASPPGPPSPAGPPSASTSAQPAGAARNKKKRRQRR